MIRILSILTFIVIALSCTLAFAQSVDKVIIFETPNPDKMSPKTLRDNEISLLER